MTRLVQAELLKLWTTRTARVLLGLTAAGTAGLVTLVLAFAGRPGQPTLGDDALRQLVAAPNGPLTLAALVLGVLGMAGEFRHGTATSTFLVTPARGRVVAAKLGAAAALTAPGQATLAMWAGGLLLAAYALALALVGGRLVVRRDLS
jgi:ABC-2 type transport system permease protein